MSVLKKIIIAPDSFKGSLSALQVCNIIADAALELFPQLEIIKLPIADGGEGFVDALLFAVGGQRMKVWVKDPLLRDIESFYGILPDGTAVIEMAAASGITLLQAEEKSALDTSTYGTGILILDALERGCRNFILGLGGSATNDGGAGAANALGIRYLDDSGEEILTGRNLVSLARIDCGKLVAGLTESSFTIACDVSNRLYGSNGAAAVYAPQKGASPQEVELLDRGLQRLAAVILEDTCMNLQSVPGTGAAGGLLAPFLAYLHAHTVPGVELVLDVVNFEHHLEECDLVITGEGKTDTQSTMGKAIAGVGRRASRRNVPTIVISGSVEVEIDSLSDFGISAIFSTTHQLASLEDAIRKAEQNLSRAALNIFRLIQSI